MSAPEGFTNIDDYVAEQERDPVMREHLRKARIELAPTLYGPRGVFPDRGHYDRMMRGEKPRRRWIDTLRSRHFWRAFFNALGGKFTD